MSNAGGVGKNLFKNSDNARSRWMLKVTGDDEFAKCGSSDASGGRTHASIVQLLSQ